MPLPTQFAQNITLLDIQLARVYLPLLVDLARRKETCTYTELVDLAKENHPENPDVQQAIPVSTGRRLEVIRLYCEQESLPDLAALVTSKSSGECGSFYIRHFDPVTARAAVFAKDWNEVLPDIDGYFDYTARRVTPRMSRSAGEAKLLMATHYRDHRDAYPKAIIGKREYILDMLKEGFDVGEAFAATANLLKLEPVDST